ncbi:arylsulfatase [Rubinisphaera margarita]|uniref:arylsulfatase n=1 Tax=Rubinisphaera margarita TaxID=2909586 RepID=UPI001EE9AE8B|nr:arylsulfatase [Rubinisphaera margarita]MCG6158123.1 arylsulfatase [Rubinisphaera margarita]
MRIALAIAMICLSCFSTTGKASDVRTPNIVFIMADDLGYGDLGCYGQKLIQTPHIDRLATEGIRFTQAYAGGPVCAASRAVLMTGLHNGHAPARDNVPHYSSYLQDEDVTIAEVLKQAGYRCGGVGKWSLGDAGTVGRATNQGFDTWFGYLNQDHAHYYFTDYLDDDEGRLELPDNHKSRSSYSHDLLTERALKFIREAKQDTPFFLYAAYTLPHFSSKDEDEHGLAVPSTEPYSNRDWDERSKKYAAMVHMLDRDVGRIVDLIDKRGLRENTLVIVTSDNGGHATVWKDFNTSGPLRGYKRDLTEGGIRVPFIARWPETIPANETSNAVIAFQDMLPTFAELAGVEAPDEIDGQSIVEALTGEPMQRAGYLYWDYGHCRPRYDQAVRWKNWKGIRLGRSSDIQLYDLNEDIGEEHDVATSHPDIVERISEIMASAPRPSEQYPIGTIYRGKPIWKADHSK